MRKIYRHVISAPLCIVGALLLCFGSCQSSDNAKVDEGASVINYPFTAQLGDISSRVEMTDLYTTGAFSCSWGRDKLKIYHKYVLNGAVQNMIPLEFMTFSSNVTSAKFNYLDNLAYCYNLDSRLYAFSSNTTGGYSSSVTDDGVSTLTATALAAQTGALDSCAQHDALYGSTTINSTGEPKPFTMNHLFGVLNFHLTSSSFSSNYPVTVTINSSAANMLPGNDGTATLAADGTKLTRTGSWSNSWSGTITPTTDGSVDVYLMTWPFSSASGTLSISCSDATSYSYTQRTVTLNDFSVAAAQLKSIPLEITSTPGAFNDTYSKLYSWDAVDFKPTVIGVDPGNVNSTTVSDRYNEHSSLAIYACKDCPNFNEISWYLSVNCYWDSGSVFGGNTTNYVMADGSYTKAGMWFKKKSLISFSSITSSGNISRVPIALTPELASNLNLHNDYFFLPAAGCVSLNPFSFTKKGVGGFYWSSTAGRHTFYSYTLCFDVKNVSLLYSERPYSDCIWEAQ